jgi:predicted nucleic acid-binding protein
MIFLDANILLEITLKDRPHYPQVKKFLETSNDATAISMLTAHLVMHFGRKEQSDDLFLLGVIAENKLISLSPEDYMWAITNEQGKDFEDALQMAMAIRAGCESFVTLDASLAKKYAGSQINIIIL